MMTKNYFKPMRIFIIFVCLLGLLLSSGYSAVVPKKPPPKKDRDIPQKNIEKKPEMKEMSNVMNYVRSMKSKDAIIPLMAQLTQRYLSGATDKNELDTIFERVLNRHPKMKRELLQNFVDSYNEIPLQMKRQKFVLPESQSDGKTTSKAITAESVANTFKTAYPDKLLTLDEKAKNERMKAPGITMKKWKDEPFADTEIMAIDIVERPVINKIVNEGKEPGEEVQISGKNFQEGKNHKIVMTYTDYEGGDPESYNATALSDSKIYFTLPDDIIAGNYDIQVQAPGMLLVGPHESKTPISDPYSYEIGVPTYKVYFNKMKCIDETRGENNEKIYNNSIVTLWGVAADERAWFVHSRKYKPFEDGTNMTYDSTDETLLTPDDNYTRVKYTMGMVIDLYEWNWTDVESGDSQEVMDWAYDWFEEMNTNGMFGIGYLFDLINMILSPLINCFVNLFTADPKLIESEYLEFSYLDLQQILNPGGSIVEHINFKGQDGEYDLTYTIKRK